MTEGQRGNSAPGEESVGRLGAVDARATVRPLAPVRATLPVPIEAIDSAPDGPIERAAPPSEGPLRDTTRLVLGAASLAAEALRGSSSPPGDDNGSAARDDDGPSLFDIALGAAVETQQLVGQATRRAGAVAGRLAELTGVRGMTRALTRAAQASLEPLAETGRAERELARDRARFVVGDVVERLDLNPILEGIDIDRVIDRVDIDKVVGRVDIDKVVGRVDIGAIVGGIDINGIVGRVDINGIVNQVDIDGIVGSIDINGIVGGVDIGGIINQVDINGIVGRVDINGIVNQVDINGIVGSIDIGAIVQHVDVGGIVQTVDVGAIVDGIDINGIVGRVDINGIVNQVDIGQIIGKVDINGIVDDVDINGIVDKVDIEEIIGKVDIDGIMQRTELGGIIAHSTSSVAGEALDLVRAQGVGLDQWTGKWVDRILRRKPGTVPQGPPALLAPDDPAVGAHPIDRATQATREPVDTGGPAATAEEQP